MVLDSLEDFISLISAAGFALLSRFNFLLSSFYGTEVFIVYFTALLNWSLLSF
jgi:hypothetical protein